MATVLYLQYGSDVYMQSVMVHAFIFVYYRSAWIVEHYRGCHCDT